MVSSYDCSICLETFGSGTRRPLVLPCGHTFCKKCLQQEVLQQRVRCPLDQKPFDSVSSLPTNFMLLQSVGTSNSSISSSRPLMPEDLPADPPETPQPNWGVVAIVGLVALLLGAVTAGGWRSALKATGYVSLVALVLVVICMVVDAHVQSYQQGRGGELSAYFYFGAYFLANWWFSGWWAVGTAFGLMLGSCAVQLVAEATGWCRPENISRRLVHLAAYSTMQASKMKMHEMRGLILVCAAVLWSYHMHSLKSALALAAVGSLTAFVSALCQQFVVVRLRVSPQTAQRLRWFMPCPCCMESLRVVSLPAAAALAACAAVLWSVHGAKAVLHVANLLFALGYLGHLHDLDSVHMQRWARAATAALRRLGRNREACDTAITGLCCGLHLMSVWMVSGFTPIVYLANVLIVLVKFPEVLFEQDLSGTHAQHAHAHAHVHGHQERGLAHDPRVAHEQRARLLADLQMQWAALRGELHGLFE